MHTAPAAPAIRYSFATLLTRPDQYAAMQASFRAGGFDEDCEWLTVDNSSGNVATAYDGLNTLLCRAVGEYVILCHQDLLLLRDGRPELDRRLAELDALDPAWAVAGNAGAEAPGILAIRITDKAGRDQNPGRLPRRVMSLDENFMIVKRSARIGFSRDLSGFHFYGADLCLVADIMGYSSYVIDFHLEHLGLAPTGKPFADAEAAFRAKWSHALRDRSMQTTCAFVRLSGHGSALGNQVREIATRRLARFARRADKRRAAKEQSD